MMIKLWQSISGSQVVCSLAMWFRFAIMVWAGLVMGCVGIDAEKPGVTTEPAAPVASNEGPETPQVDAGAAKKSGFTWEDWQKNRTEVFRRNDAAELSGEESEFESKPHLSSPKDDVTKPGADSTGSAR